LAVDHRVVDLHPIWMQNCHLIQIDLWYPNHS